MTHAVAYLRVSGASQSDGEGWARQLDAISTYARGHDIELIREYREDAVPGKTELLDRPAFMEMVVDLESNGCKLILIEKLDRLARDLMVQETIIGDLRKRGLGLISACEPDLCSTDPSRVLVRQIFGAIAQYEKDMLVAKLAHSRAQVRKRGGFGGGNVPYGHTCKGAGPAQLARAAHERTTARWIQELRAGGTTYDGIKQKLTAAGIRPRNGKPWQISSIRQIALQGGKQP